MNNETWKDIQGFEGLYKINRLGQVLSCCRYIERGVYKGYTKERILKQQIDSLNKYVLVSLCKKKKYKTILVHRLVAQAFIPNSENKPQVNHINGVKTDNCVENLEWCSSSDNHKHSYKFLNRKVNKGMKGKLGIHNHLSRSVMQIKDNEIIKIFDSIATAFRETKIRHISECANKKANMAGGFVWRFI